ncbi:hypothetical protein FQA39_LY16020 [Lamprigera yunnana]|nr:hypothetical protein FQA39_LY16020 [Lamprigera yunnana]
MSIDFYYTPGSGPCRIVELVAKTVGVKLVQKPLDLMKKEQLSPEFVKINPQHCVPTIVDNDLVLWESNVIATYLLEQYSKDDSLYPKDTKKRALVDQRLYFNNGVLAQRFGEYYYPIMMTGAAPDLEKYKRMEEALEFLNTFLKSQEFVAGNNLTVADYVISTTITTFLVAKFDISPYKDVEKWYKKVKGIIPGFGEFNDVEALTKLFEKYLKK